MSFVRNAFQTMHPLAQTVMLGCIVLTCMAVGAGMGVLWLSMAHGTDPAALTQAGAMTRESMLVLNNANQLVAFLGASLAFGALVGFPFLGGFALKRPHAMMLLLAVVLALGMSPLLDFSYRLNEWMLVPGSSIHAWAGALEAQAMAMTRTILTFDHGGQVLGVLFAVGLLPALCEEWLFRGTLQPILVRATGNIHLSVWLAAALFSAIHMQFFGFIPRMLLGTIFGYLVAFSGSLWPAVLGHFVNNAGVVLAAWWMGAEWLDEGLEPQPLEAWGMADWGMAVAALMALGWGLRTLVSRGDLDVYLSSFNLGAKPSAQTPLQS